MAVPDLHTQAQRQKELLLQAMKKLERLAEPERETLLRDFQELQDNIDRLIETAARPPGDDGQDAPAYARAARREAARMEAVVNNLSAGVVVYDQLGTVQLANGYAIALLGFDPLGMQRERLFHKVQVYGQNGERMYTDRMPSAQAAAGDVVMNQPLTLKNAFRRSYHLLVSAMPITIGKEFHGVVSVLSDVTAQHLLNVELEQQNARLELALKEAQEGRRILQALMEYVPEGITIADAPDVNIRMVSKHGQQLTGRPIEEISGISAEEHPQRWQIYYPDSGALVPGEDLPLSRATLQGEVVENEELIMRRASGEEITILCNAGPIRDEHGQISGGIIAWRDATERRQFMQALKESEERFRALADNMSQLAWMADPDGAIFWYNQRWFDYTGTRLAEVEGWGWQKLHHPDHVQRVTGEYRRCFAAGEVWEDTFQLRGADGQYRWFLSRAVPIGDAEGRVLRWFGTNTDVTQQREAQEAVRESERRFRVALASVPIVVFSMDRDLRYTWVYNPRHNLTEADLIGQRDEDFYPEEDIAELLAAKRQVIETSFPVQREIKMRVQNETVLYILTLDPVLDEAGVVTGLIGAGLDVTKQRRLEAQQMEFVTEMEVQRRLLEHRERERQEIAREIHDGPIQSMVSALFNIQFAKEALLDRDARAVLDQMMGTMKHTVQELRQVVNQLRPPVLIRFGLSRAIQIHAEDMRARYPELKIDLELTEDENVLPEEVCLALYRVYQEAIANVVRHAQASQVAVRYYPDGAFMRMEIEDNGRGFEVPSDWVHYTRQNHFGVAGMRERVDAVGGKLKLSTALEKGTLVMVKVPLQQSGDVPEEQL